MFWKKRGLLRCSLLWEISVCRWKRSWLLASGTNDLKPRVFPRIYHMHEVPNTLTHINVCNFKETLTESQQGKRVRQPSGSSGFCAESHPLGTSPWTDMGTVVFIYQFWRHAFLCMPFSLHPFCGSLPQMRHECLDNDCLLTENLAQCLVKPMELWERLLLSLAWIDSGHKTEHAFQECFSKTLLGINAMEGKFDMWLEYIR